MTADTTQQPARPGELAYFAYGESVGWRTYDGRDMPGWDKLGERIQGGWAAAARVAVARASAGPAAFAAWWTSGDGWQPEIAAEDLAQQAWDASAARFAEERALMLDDLGDLLRALGMFDGAQPQTPHQVMQDAIAELRRRLPGPDDHAWPQRLLPATVTCSLCGAPLTPRPVSAGAMFTLERHDCPNAPGAGIAAYRTPDGQVWHPADVTRIIDGRGDGYRIGAAWYPAADVTIIRSPADAATGG